MLTPIAARGQSRTPGRDFCYVFTLWIHAVDTWHMPSFVHQPRSLAFSWGLCRQQGRLLLERLDRFYIGDWASYLGGSICIWLGTSMSDHSPVSLTIAFARPLAWRGSRIPDRLLSTSDLSARIAQIWGADPISEDPIVQDMHSEFLASCMRESSTSCRETTSACRREAVQCERSLLAPLASVQ